MDDMPAPRWLTPARRLLGRWFEFRQWWLAKVLTGLYGQPMKVLPAGHVGLAGALVLWTVQDGGRQMLLVRQGGKGHDGRLRLVSCPGLGRHPDMVAAVRAAAQAQLGEAFARSLKLDRQVTADRVAAAPQFTHRDEATGIAAPVQVLVWLAPFDPVQLDLLAPAAGMEVELAREEDLRRGAVDGLSPTHLALWRSVLRHLPQRTLPREEDAGAREERLAGEAGPPAKRLH